MDSAIDKQQVEDEIGKRLHALAISSITAFTHTDFAHKRILLYAHVWGALEEDVNRLKTLSATLHTDVLKIKEWAVRAAEVRYLPQESEHEALSKISGNAEETIHDIFDLFSDIIVETPNFYGDETLEKHLRLARGAVETLESRIQMEFPS